MILELHPLCTLFPRITGAEFDALKADIAANGLRQPIVTHGGFILDGGNRHRACMELGIVPATVEFDGGNLVSYVLSVNLHRRHLSPGQQAAIVASATDWGKAQTVGGDRKSDHSATLPNDRVSDRAAQSGASIRTQGMADAVARKSPELARQVAHGEISLPKAHEQLAPKKEPAPEVAQVVDISEVEVLREQLAEQIERNLELAGYLKSTMSDNEMMVRVFDADDRLKAAMAEVARYKAMADNAKQSADAKQGEYIARAKAVTMWQNKAVKFEKELASLRGAK